MNQVIENNTDSLSNGQASSNSYQQYLTDKKPSTVKHLIRQLREHARDLWRQADALEGSLNEQISPRRIRGGATDLRVRRCIEAAATYYHVDQTRLMSHDRTLHVAEARKIAYYLTRTANGFSYPDIAVAFARNHSTIIHGCQDVEARMLVRPMFATEVNAILARLRAEN